MAKYLKPSQMHRHIRQQKSDIERQPPLIYAGGQVSFRSEKDLEKFLVENLQEFFPELEILDSQVTLSNQRIDILALHRETRQGFILELKNEEDRGIVPQLTRYRKALVTQQPFSDRLDYQQPIQMIAIAPSFHDDNRTDRESSKFEDHIHLIPYYIQNHSGQVCYLILNQKMHRIPWPIAGLINPDNSPSLEEIENSLLWETQQALMSLGKRQWQRDFIPIRATFLLQHKCKEFIADNCQSFLYASGTGETHKRLAEVICNSGDPSLYLWLPCHHKQPAANQWGRFCLWMQPGTNPFDPNSPVEYIIYCPNGKPKPSDRPQNRFDRKYARSGMVKWSPTQDYLSFLKDHTYFYLLCHLFPTANLRTQIVAYSHKQTPAPTHLGWYLDLALRLWNYRVLGKNFLETEPRFQQEATLTCNSVPTCDSVPQP
jgi:hypothetical protein